jgi:hypothetical protein
MPALTLAYVPTLPLSRTAQLGDCRRLVELGDRAEHLAHQLGRIPTATRAPQSCSYKWLDRRDLSEKSK